MWQADQETPMYSDEDFIRGILVRFSTLISKPLMAHFQIMINGCQPGFGKIPFDLKRSA